MDDNSKKITVFGAASVVAYVLSRKYRYNETRNKRRMWVRDIYLKRKPHVLFDNLVKELGLSNTELFFNFSRMTASTFEYLLSLCGSYLVKHSQREAIAPATRLMVTLRFLVTGDSYPSLGYTFKIAPSTICKIIFETCNILWQVLSPRVLKLPITQEWLSIAEDFNNLWHLPNCLGGIDGKNVHIKAPSHTGSQYLHYKNNFAIVLLAVCDSKYFLTHINVGAYKSQCDGGVLKKSEFGQLLQSGTLNIPNLQKLPNANDDVPFFFVGNEAFPLQVNLMRPYSKKRKLKMPEDQLVFNYRLSRGIRIIENTVGILTARFRIYHRVINADPETVDAIVKATACLHNFIKLQESDTLIYCGHEFVDREVDGIITPGLWRKEIPRDCALGTINLRFGNRNFTNEAFSFREYLKTYFNGNGSIPWRLDYVRSSS